MPETTSNVEMAHRIHEEGHRPEGRRSRRERRLEILEAVALAAVAVLTAWSGYQAARWDSRSAASYARAARVMVQAQAQHVLAGQDHLYDTTTFDSWLDAHVGGNVKLAEAYERRFRPEYRTAFQAWMKTDPFRNPNAPPGAMFMPEYRNARAEKARELSEQAGAAYEAGVAARETGDEYIRITVLLATVLLLTALGQRFQITGPRIGILAVAFVILAIASWCIATYLRA